MRHDKKRLYFNTLKTNQPEFLLNTRQTHYVKNVLRLTHGTEIELFDGEGQWLIAALDLSQRKKVLATPITEPQTIAFTSPKITLVQGICKPGAMDLVLEKATELGAYQIIPVLCDYTSHTSQKLIRQRTSHWNSTLINAGMQCRTYYLPRLAPIQTLAQWCSANQSVTPTTYWFHLAPEAQKFQPALSSEITLVIGPEGGFSPTEVALLKHINPQFCTLGHNILRTETAAIASLSICLHALS